MDSFYTSTQLAHALLHHKVFICGSLKTAGRAPIPLDIMTGDAADRNKVPRGTMDFRYSNDQSISYCRWMDKRAVVICYTTPFIGDSYGQVARKVKEPNGQMHRIVVNRPDIVEYYNWFMRGVDVSYVF